MTKEEIRIQYKTYKINFEEAMKLLEDNTDMWHDDAKRYLLFVDSALEGNDE